VATNDSTDANGLLGGEDPRLEERREQPPHHAMAGLEKVCELWNSGKKKEGRYGWEVDLATELGLLSPSAAYAAVTSSSTSGFFLSQTQLYYIPLEGKSPETSSDTNTETSVMVTLEPDINTLAP
jgi:hypothetical protein